MLIHVHGRYERNREERKTQMREYDNRNKTSTK